MSVSAIAMFQNARSWEFDMTFWGGKLRQLAGVSWELSGSLMC
jgi:hypothetical protein